MIQDFLTARGYEVIACGSAEVALKWARTLARKLDLVICDLLLPDLPGDMLVEQLREQRPEMKVIFMSGQLGAADAMQVAATDRLRCSLHREAIQSTSVSQRDCGNLGNRRAD